MFCSLFTSISDANNVYDIGETGSVPCRFSNMREAFKKKIKSLVCSTLGISIQAKTLFYKLLKKEFLALLYFVPF